MMFGDAIIEIYQDLSFGHYLAANLYLYSFLFFAICVVQNIFIIVMQEAYFTARDVNLQEELLGKQNVASSSSPNLKKDMEKPQVKESMSRSKMTLSKMLQEDRRSSIANVSRSKSGYIEYKARSPKQKADPKMISDPEIVISEIESMSKQIMSNIIDLKQYTQDQVNKNPFNKDEIFNKFESAMKKIESKIRLSKNLVGNK